MKTRAFTLIEILVVVAIIGILAAIAIPNYLTAQTRAKVARVQADMRNFETAVAAYVIDHTKRPPTHDLGNTRYDPLNWWGYLTTSLTTPVAYLTGLPPMTFNDTKIQARWIDEEPKTHRRGNQPCTFVRDTWNLAYRFKVGELMSTTETAVLPRGSVYTAQMREKFDKSGFVLYNCGPDLKDSTALALPEIYDPSNGTTSYGELYVCGPGTPVKPGTPEAVYNPGHG